MQGREGRAGKVARLPGLNLMPATLEAYVIEAVALCGGDCNPMWQWPPESHIRHPRLHVRLLVHWRRRLPEGALWLVRRPGPPSAGALTIERPRPRYNWDVCCVQQLAAGAGAGRLTDQPGLAGAAVRRMRARPLAPNDPCEHVPVARASAALPPQHPRRRFIGAERRAGDKFEVGRISFSGCLVCQHKCSIGEGKAAAGENGTRCQVLERAAR